MKMRLNPACTVFVTRDNESLVYDDVAQATHSLSQAATAVILFVQPAARSLDEIRSYLSDLYPHNDAQAILAPLQRIGIVR